MPINHLSLATVVQSSFPLYAKQAIEVTTMRKLSLASSLKFSALLITTFLLTRSPPLAQSTQIKGVIDGRAGATMSVKVPDSPDTTILLSDMTNVQEVEGVFHGRKKEMARTALIPGLPVDVSRTMNAQNQLAADTVRFKGSDLKAAMDAQAGLQPTMQKVAANTAQIQQTEQ